MTAAPEICCQGCGESGVSVGYRVPNQPVVSNYRFTTAVEASRVARRDIVLAECSSCGLVFNAGFDPDLVPYDENYHNNQCCSEAFAAYLDQLAADLTGRYRLRGRRVLELGCGKGDFLRVLARIANISGDGYDTTYVGPPQLGPLRFHRSHLQSSRIHGTYAAILCRHVIEHVARIGEFFVELRAMAVGAGDPVIMLETPAFEWMAAHGCFWDVCYEHCNYFSAPALARLAERSGFVVLSHTRTFGGQYQVIELRLGAPPSHPLSEVDGALKQFAGAAAAERARWQQWLASGGASQGWAVWGAGAKGVALVSQVAPPPSMLIDSNPAKQGCIVPGSEVPIVSPDDERVLDSPVVVVANPNYFAEISRHLQSRGFTHSLVQI